MKFTLVTGTSTGIGRGIARVLVEQGHHVFGSVRNESDAFSLQEELGENFTPLIFDVTDVAAIAAAVEKVKLILNGEPLYGLVNNAGMSAFGPMLYMPHEEFRYQMEVNIIGLHQVTQAFLPLLGARPGFTGRPGKIINISSIGGTISMAFIGPYVASKHAVEGYTHALRKELLMYGIDVIIVAPGQVKTPIMDKGIMEGVERYSDTEYGDGIRTFREISRQSIDTILRPVDVGKKVHQLLEKKKTRVHYVVTRNPIKDYYVLRWMPARMLDKAICKLMNLLKPAERQSEAVSKA